MCVDRTSTSAATSSLFGCGSGSHPSGIDDVAGSSLDLAMAVPRVLPVSVDHGPCWSTDLHYICARLLVNHPLTHTQAAMTARPSHLLPSTTVAHGKLRQADQLSSPIDAVVKHAHAHGGIIQTRTGELLTTQHPHRRTRMTVRTRDFIRPGAMVTGLYETQSRKPRNPSERMNTWLQGSLDSVEHIVPVRLAC